MQKRWMAMEMAYRAKNYARPKIRNIPPLSQNKKPTFSGWFLVLVVENGLNSNHALTVRRIITETVGCVRSYVSS